MEVNFIKQNYFLLAIIYASESNTTIMNNIITNSSTPYSGGIF